MNGTNNGTNGKEYIERGALIEMLNNKAKTDHETGLYNHGALTESFIRFVERQPAADVVEVVRCKDCVSCRPLNRKDRFEAIHPEYWVYCMREDCGKKPDDFCSWGERKEQT